MKLKATDSVIVSNVQAEPLEQGQKFEVEDGQGEQLVKRGLAELVGGAKADPKPTDKKAADPANKAAPAAETK